MVGFNVALALIMEDFAAILGNDSNFTIQTIAKIAMLVFHGASARGGVIAPPKTVTAEKNGKHNGHKNST